MVCLQTERPRPADSGRVRLDPIRPTFWPPNQNQNRITFPNVLAASIPKILKFRKSSNLTKNAPKKLRDFFLRAISSSSARVHNMAQRHIRNGGTFGRAPIPTRHRRRHRDVVERWRFFSNEIPTTHGGRPASHTPLSSVEESCFCWWAQARRTSKLG